MANSHSPHHIPKQGIDTSHPAYCSFVPVNTEFSPLAGINDPYNPFLPSSGVQCTPQNYTIENFPQINNIWDSKVLLGDIKAKQAEKIDSIELMSKELSPASYCSNFDIFMADPNCYKVDNQWYYSNQKVMDAAQNLPSCAKATELNQEKLDNCSHHKDVKTDLNSSKEYDYRDLQNVANNRNMQNLHNVDCQYNLYCYGKIPATNVSYVPNNTCNIPFKSIVNTLDPQTECSNEESDIIVEESDEGQTDYSEEQDRTFQVNKCLICNTIYKPLGIQFFYLTSKNPLTMSSQTPVLFKLGHIVGDFRFSKTYLCCECLGLLNVFDNLQCKLENVRKEIFEKFKKTCSENNTQCSQTNNQSVTRTTSVNNRSLQYKCKICLKILSLKKYLYYHVKRHKNKGYLCEMCGRKFKRKRIFLIHRKNHLKKPVSKIISFKCSNCDKMFRTKSNKKEHENFCLGIFPYECRNQHCDKKFASVTKLKNHMKLKHDKKFIAICSICNIGFVKVSDYKSHMITHSTDKKFTCKDCDKSYKTLSNLNFHMKIHSKKLPFNCTICMKGFMRKEYLEAHVNNHKGIKNFKCAICGKKFVSQKNLDSHLKYHEGTVKTKTCNICGKTMTTGYEEHSRIHNNLREFECDTCNFRFNTKGALSKHKNKKHLKVQKDVFKISTIGNCQVGKKFE